jgi:hypothetical protein
MIITFMINQNPNHYQAASFTASRPGSKPAHSATTNWAYPGNMHQN